MYFVHVNRNIIASNTKHGRSEPAVRIQKGRYGKPTYATEVRLPAGGIIRYSPLSPILPCGARLVIECEEKPEVIS